MYRLITNKDELVLVYNNRTVFKHTLSRPFITVGFSTLNYKSTHGAFKVKETGKGKKLALFDYKIRENIIAFSCGETKLEVTILENDNGLDMTFIKQGNFTNITFDFYAAKEECIFGGGEQFRKLNMKGEKIINFVSEHIKIRPIALKLLFGKIYYRERRHSEIETYSPMSTFVSSHRYAIRVDTNDYGINDFKQGDSTLLTYWGTPDRISYFCADSFKELSRKLNNDIPCNEYLPDWAYDGMILGVQGGIERSMDKALAMKAAGAAVCGIWCQDWSGRKITAAGKQVYWNWEVDNRSYGDLKTKIAELKAQGIHFLAYINPYLIKDGEMYNYCKEKGYLIKNSAGEIYHIKSTTFDAGMMDLTHPDMVKYLKETIIIKNMLELGIDGYMADFGEYLPVDSVLYSSEDAKILHNEWPVIWARINREAVNDSGREKDVFFFTRSGYNAAQKYTTIMWNGDQHTDYSYDYGMPCVIPASINLGFSGLCATHSDVGGYISFGSLRRDAELFVRWMEMNTFSLLMRTHETVRPENNAQYDDEKVIKYSVKLTNVHKLIKPYLLHCMKETADGLPVMRAPFYEFNDMAEYKSDYVYMLGSDIFVAPVLLAGADRKKLFLPQGEWVHMFSGKSYQSGEQIVDAPLGSPAVFYRKDSEHKDLFEKVKNIN